MTHSLGLGEYLGIKEYPRFLGMMLILFVVMGVFTIVGSSFATFPVFVGITFFLGIYKPKWFVLLALAYLIFYQTFVLRQTYLSWGVSGGFGRGELFLRFLRRAHPGSPTVYQLPKVIFAAALIRIGFQMRNKSGFWKMDQKRLLLFGFLIMSLLSAIANLAFDKTTIRFFIEFCIPFVLFYYIKTVRYSEKELAILFGLLMFLCIETQILFSWLNNIEKLMGGNLFFGDWAVGTYAYPHYEGSSYVLTLGYFVFLYRFLIHRKRVDLFRAVLALYGILSISVILYTVVLLGVTAISFLFTYVNGIINIRELILALLMGCLLGGVVVWALGQDEGSSDHIDKHMAKNDQREWWEIPKIYSFVNLYNMMTEEDKVFFGAGPARFLTRFGHGPIQRKYQSWAVYDTNQLSSSEFLENSIVGLVGEIGIQGFLLYIFLYLSFYRDLQQFNNWYKKSEGQPDGITTAALMLMLMFFASSFIYNTLEEFNITTPFMIMVALIYQSYWAKRRKEAEEKATIETQPIVVNRPVATV